MRYDESIGPRPDGLSELFPRSELRRKTVHGAELTPDADGVALALPPARGVLLSPDLSPETPWPVVLQMFVNVRVEALNTRRAYTRACETALNWLGVERLADLTGPMLADYRAYVIDRPDWGPSSRQLNLYAFKALLKWARAYGLHHLDHDLVFETLRTPKGVVQRPVWVVSPEQSRAIIRANEGRLLTLALVHVGLGAGLRASELAALKLRDCLPDFDGGPALFVDQGKGKRDRTVPILTETWNALSAYVASTERSFGDPGKVFLAADRARGHRGNSDQITASGIWHQLRVAFDRAGLDIHGFGCHGLRRTYAFTLYRHTRDYEVVRRQLGHASIVTTQRYISFHKVGDLRASLPPTFIGAEGGL